MLATGSIRARWAAGALALVATFATAFALARAGGSGHVRSGPLRLVGGVPLGVEDSAAGALAAADNYVAAGVTDSLDRRSLGAFADAVVAPAERQPLLDASERLAQQGGPPPGTNVISTVVAQRLRGYTSGTARVTTWDLGSYWGAGLEPIQYWALVDLSLRWMGGRWWVVSLEERLPGPVPALVASGASTSASWGEALAGMRAPYYGGG
jgi:hypothetical protein